MLLDVQGVMLLAGAMSQVALSQRRASWQRPGRWSASLSAMPRPASRWALLSQRLHHDSDFIPICHTVLQHAAHYSVC